MRTVTIPLLVLVAATALPALGEGLGGVAQSRTCGDHPSSPSPNCNNFGSAVALGDFDGDGYRDVAVGSPGDSAIQANGGRVSVSYGSASGFDTVGATSFTQDATSMLDAVQAGDAFGTSLATGDFDDDGYDDLAIGVPYENSSGVSDAGAVQILYGASTGLDASRDQFIHQDSVVGDTVLGVNEAGDQYGYAVATGDFDDDGYDDLAIGVPGQELAGNAEAGMVNILYGSASGITAVGDMLLAQDFATITGNAEVGDRFGAALASGDFDNDGHADLAVGIPGETIGEANAGNLQILYGSSTGITHTGNQQLHEDLSSLLGSADLGDFFGWALATGDIDADGRDDLAVGVPGEDGSQGSVHILFGSSGGITTAGDVVLTSIDPDSLDQFGSALTFGDFNRDGYADLVVGVPGTDFCATGFPVCSPKPDAGSAEVFVGTPSGPSYALWLSRAPDEEASDYYASSLAAGDVTGDQVDDLVSGVPGLGTEGGILLHLGDDCGNGVINPGEQCDDGNETSQDGCSAVCVQEYCSDGILQSDPSGLAETCDDGNLTFQDGCSAACQVESCGDGVWQGRMGERCDDGNTQALDGCDASCQNEDSIEVTGSATGGSVLFSVEGIALSVATSGSLTPEQIAQAIALEINGDSSLGVLGISAQAVGAAVYTDGAVSGVSSTDAGLSASAGPPAPVFLSDGGVGYFWVLEHQILGSLTSSLPPVSIAGVGVAGVSASGDGALTSFSVDDAITGSVSVPVTATSGASATSLQFTGGVIPGGGWTAVQTALSNSSPGILGADATASGELRLCYLPECAISLPLELRAGAGTTTTLSSPTQVGMFGSWTPHTVTDLFTTAAGNFEARATHGFGHGPLSATGSVAAIGGVLQLVAPSKIISVAGDVRIVSRLTIQFIPEPGAFGALAAGAALLGWLGRRRSRRG